MSRILTKAGGGGVQMKNVGNALYANRGHLIRGLSLGTE